MDQTMDREALKAEARRRLEAVAPELFELSRWLYENPETAFEEHASSARLATWLDEHGFDVTYPAYGLATAFEATVGEGPEVVICAEYDALPGVGHACGHNIIAASALGAAYAVADAARALGVRVRVLGTPAEEHMGGKVDLLHAGAFDGAAAAMMVHPAPLDVVDPNTLAVRHVDLHYRGRESHAAAAPHKGINALDAFVQAYVNVSTLRQHLLDTDKIHGIITHGGDAPNIIPGYTRSSWYVRARSAERLAELWTKVEACFAAGATATGCQFQVEEVGHTYEELVSDPLLVELFARNAEALGRPMARGADLPPGEAGSTDMGNVSRRVPSIHPFLSIHPGEAVNHQPAFADHTITPDGEKAIVDGALAMAWTIIDLAGRWDELGAALPGRDR